MPPYTIEQIRNEVSSASEECNATAPLGEKIASVSLLGSYADGRVTRRSDIDLLVRFTSAIVSLLTLARVLSCMEESLRVSVDVVQDSVSDDSLLVVNKVVPLYERL